MGNCLNPNRVICTGGGARQEETRSRSSSAAAAEADQKNMDQMLLLSPPNKSDEERIKSKGEVGAKKVRFKLVDAQEEDQEEEKKNKKGGAKGPVDADNAGDTAGGSGGGFVSLRIVVTEEELKWILECNKKDLKCASVEQLLNVMKAAVRSRKLINEEDRVIGRKGRRSTSRRGWKPDLDSIAEEPYIFN